MSDPESLGYPDLGDFLAASLARRKARSLAIFSSVARACFSYSVQALAPSRACCPFLNAASARARASSESMHISVGAPIVNCSSSECRAANRLTSYLGTFWSKKSSTADPILSGWLIGLLGLSGRPRGGRSGSSPPIDHLGDPRRHFRIKPNAIRRPALFTEGDAHLIGLGALGRGEPRRKSTPIGLDQDRPPSFSHDARPTGLWVPPAQCRA